MKLVLLGAPGSGKGTLAGVLKEALGIPHISTGDIFREAVKNQTPVGKKVESVLAAGELVSDQLTSALVAERMEADDAANGFLLDGYPRNLTQAEDLTKIRTPDKVLNLALEDSIIIKRLTSRRICKSCGSVFNVLGMPPKKKGVCDLCQGDLYTRPDDTEASISRRLDIYREQTQPLIDFYSQAGILLKVDADAELNSLKEKVLKLLA